MKTLLCTAVAWLSGEEASMWLLELWVQRPAVSGTPFPNETTQRVGVQTWHLTGISSERNEVSLSIQEKKMVVLVANDNEV